MSTVSEGAAGDESERGGRPFDFVWRLRPDLIIVRPPLAGAPSLIGALARLRRRVGLPTGMRDACLAPAGISGANFNDHLAVCARGAAEAYFEGAWNDYNECNGNFAKQFRYGFSNRPGTVQAPAASRMARDNVLTIGVPIYETLMRSGAMCASVDECPRFLRTFHGDYEKCLFRLGAYSAVERECQMLRNQICETRIGAGSAPADKGSLGSYLPVRQAVTAAVAGGGDGDHGRELIGSVFRPFAPNATRAFATEFRDSMTEAWARRDAAARKHPVPQVNFSWNSVGVAFPLGWDYTSPFQSNVLEPFYLLTGPKRQVEAMQNLLRFDHRHRRRLDDGAFCARRLSMLHNLACDGFAQTSSWGLPDSFVDSLARESHGILEAVARRPGTPKGIVVASGHSNEIRALSSRWGKAFLENSTLMHLAREYVARDVVVSGYELVRLTNDLNAHPEQYDSGLWHHDRCGNRVKAFLYLHDVADDGSRPTEIARGTHNTLYYSHHVTGESRFADEFVRANYDVVAMKGRKGGGFVFDTNALHRGVTRGLKDRNVLILRFHSKSREATGVKKGCHS